MAEAQKGNEQSMDDILASIRRIISDDPLAPNPAGTAHADGGAALMGAQAEPEAGVASSERGANGGAGLRNPTDDLSDILEPSKVPSARPGGPEPGPEESALKGKGASEQAVSSWIFDAGAEKSQLSGSLKDKLASLDGRGQPDSNSGAASLGEGIGPAPSRVEVDPPATDNLDESKAASAEAGLPSLGNEVGAAEPGEPVQAIPGAVKLSDADVASIPSVQAVVEQTAAETRAEDLHARGQNATSDGQIIDTPQAEIAAGQETKGPENELSGAAKADNPLDGDASGSTTGHAAAALGIAAATQPSSDSSKTLEALVSEALEPKLQQWLDANLPRLVDEKVQAEIERLARDGKLSTS